MVSIETRRKVRLDRSRGLGTRSIARQRGISRNTVREILRSEALESRYLRRSEKTYPRLEGFLGLLESELETEEAKPAGRRRKLTRVFELLQGQGFEGSYDSVRRYAGSWRRQRRVATVPAQACTPLIFRLGEAFQFDWFSSYAVLSGVTTPVHGARVTLCKSRMSYCRAYPREKLEMVLDAHNMAFTFFGGVPERGIYDNMRTVVSRILKGRDREWQKTFTLLSSHYLFEHEACTPGAGNEKGLVERGIQSMEEDFFKPYPHALDWDDLNAQLEAECLKRARQRPHPEEKSRTLWDVFCEERSILRPLPTPFDGFVPYTGRVSNTLLVNHDRNRYSVEAKAAGCVVDIRAYANRVVFVLNGRVVGGHVRCFGHDKTVTQIEHYIPVLERKPGTIRNGLPYQEEHLPKALADLRSHMARHHDDADRQFVDVLCAAKDYGMEAVIRASEEALKAGTPSRDVVLNILYRSLEVPPAPQLNDPGYLKLREDPSSDCHTYDAFLKEPSHVHEPTNP